MSDREYSKYDCEREGVVMSGFAVRDKGEWRDAFPFKPSGHSCTGTCFVSLNEPSGKHYPASEAVVEEHGGYKGRALLFRDMECRKKNPKGWWDDFDVLVSKPAWCSTLHPASEPPGVDELAGRMMQDLAKLEQEGRQNCLKYCRTCGYCNGEKYDPDRLGAPKLIEAAEFEIAPGEPVFFIQLQRSYACTDQSNPSIVNSSNWCAILRKDGLHPLWKRYWVDLDDIMQEYDRPLGAADVDGDGVYEVIIINMHYGGGDFRLYQYKPGEKTLACKLVAGDQM